MVLTRSQNGLYLKKLFVRFVVKGSSIWAMLTLNLKYPLSSFHTQQSLHRAMLHQHVPVVTVNTSDGESIKNHFGKALPEGSPWCTCNHIRVFLQHLWPLIWQEQSCKYKNYDNYMGIDSRVQKHSSGTILTFAQHSTCLHRIFPSYLRGLTLLLGF